MQTHEYLAPAKINLSLEVIRRRADGYHLLESIFALVDLHDILSFELNNQHHEFKFYSNESKITQADNLIYKAYLLLKQYRPFNAGIQCTLKKNIPMGAGLGGGSSNAATTLIALNYLLDLKLSRIQLQKLGLQLGADVPFFIFGKNAFVSGIGETLQALNLKIKNYIIVYPKIFIPTKKIFESLILTQPKRTSIIYRLNDEAKMVNDLQETAFTLYPELVEYYQIMQRFGQTRMTGSGSCLFIEVPEKTQALLIKEQLPKDWVVFCTQMLSHHPLEHLVA